MEEPIKTYLNSVKSICPQLTDKELNYIESGLTISELKNREEYIKQNCIQKEIGFVYSGLLRGFYVDDFGNQITIKFIKENEFVTIEGEVKYPGSYIISSKDERISDLLARAGGLTEWAFLEGAYIDRANAIDGSAFTVLDLKNLIDKGEKRFDYIIRSGDKIVIPRTQDFIKLSGAVRFPKVSEFGTINIPVHYNKNTRFYVNKYGGGFHKKAKKSKIYVESPGGQAKRTINFGLFKIYPKVRVGDHIYIVYKEEKIKKEENKNPIDWNAVIEKTTIKLTGFGTLYVLLQRINF